MLKTVEAIQRSGVDGIAVKPTEVDVAAAADVGVEIVAIDWEGPNALPDLDVLAALASQTDLRLTTPVRADGFDPLGDDGLLDGLPETVGRILVAGHPAYLTPAERSRAVAPRLAAGLERAPDAWVGTESIERIATATGAAQYDLLSSTTEREVAALRAAGFDGEIAVYAPTVLSTDDDVVLESLGEYVARRGPVARSLPDDAVTDERARGSVRERLLAAVDDFALVGDERTVRQRVERLRSAGVDTVVAYPAEGPRSLSA